MRFIRHEEGYPSTVWWRRAGLPDPAPDNHLGIVYADMLDDYNAAKNAANRFRAENGLSAIE